jgi:hypothetical protein
VPDILIKDDIDWQNPSQKAWMDIVSEYAIRYNLSHHGGELISTDRINEVMKDLPSDTAIIQELTILGGKRSSTGDQSLVRYLADNKEDILRITKATLVAYRTGEEGWYVGFNTSDPVVAKARQLVRLDLMAALKAN